MARRHRVDSKGPARGAFRGSRLTAELVPSVLARGQASNIETVRITSPNMMVELVGESKDVGRDAERIAKIMSELGQKKYRNPWISGSFYLAAFVIVTAVVLKALKIAGIVFFSLMMLGSVSVVLMIGALQLRHDGSLSQKNFLKLAHLILRKSSSLKKN